MLLIIPAYFIGKSYYTLAKLHHRNAWGYGVFGALTFFGAQFLFVILIGLLIVAADIRTEIPTFFISLTALAFGALFTSVLEHFIKRNWEKRPRSNSSGNELIDQED